MTLQDRWNVGDHHLSEISSTTQFALKSLGLRLEWSRVRAAIQKVKTFCFLAAAPNPSNISSLAAQRPRHRDGGGRTLSSHHKSPLPEGTLDNSRQSSSPCLYRPPQPPAGGKKLQDWTVFVNQTHRSGLA